MKNILFGALSLLLFAGCHDLQSPKGALGFAGKALQKKDYPKFKKALAGDALRMFGSKEKASRLRSALMNQFDVENVKDIQLVRMTSLSSTYEYEQEGFEHEEPLRGYRTYLAFLKGNGRKMQVRVRCLMEVHGMRRDLFELCKIIHVR